MAIIGSAEVEVRADVRKLGRDIKDSFSDLSKTADDIADKMGKSIGDSIKNNLDGLTIKVNIDDSILDDIIEIEEQINRISNQTVKIDLDDSAMDKVNTYHGKTLRYDVDLDTTYLDAQLAKIADQKIDLKVDNKSAKAIRDSVEKTVSSIPAPSRTVPVDMDIDSRAMNFLNEKMKKAMEGAQRVAKKHAEPIDLELNTDQLMEHLEMLKDYETEDIEQGITIDQSDLEEINSAIESLRQYNQANAIELEVDLHIAKAMAQLAVLTRKRFVEIVPKINAKAMALAQGTLAGFTGFNIMKEHTEDFIRSLTELDKQLPQIALLLTAVSAAVPAAGWGAGTLMTLVGDIAALSGLAVPGAAIMTAFGSSIFFMNNAFDQQNKKKYIPQITAQLGELSSAIAGDFWAVAEPSYNNFAFKTLPSIYNATKGVNTGMAHLSSSFWDTIGAVIETDRGMGNLKETSRNIERGMMGLSGAFYPAMQGMLTFVRAGSKYLPELGDYIETLAHQFDEWVMSMDESGQLDEWALAGKNALLDLGSIIVSTVGIFYSLYQVADRVGFPGLSEIATGLDSLNKSLQGSKAQDTLFALGVAVNEAFGKMAEGLSWVGPLISDNMIGILTAISTMGDIVSGVLGGIGDALTNTGLVDSFFGLLESMKTAVEEFRPAFEAIGTIMAVTFDFLGSALENITPILTQFFVNLANDAVLVKPSLMGILDIFGEWGPRVMEVVGVVTNGIAEWFGKLDPVFALVGLAVVGLGGVFTSIGSVIYGALTFVDDVVTKIDDLLRIFGKATSVSDLLSGGLKGVTKSFPMLGKAVGFLSGPFGWIIGAFVGALVASEDLRKAVGGFLGNAFKTLLAFIQPLIGPIGTLFSTLMSGLDKVSAAVAPAFTGLFNAMNSLMPVLQLVAHILGAVLGGAIKTLSTILGSAFNTISTVVGGIANIIGGAFNAISSVITGVIGIVKGLISGDMTAVADAAKGMWDGLKDAWTQMLDGAINAVVGVFTGAFDSVASAVKGLFEGALHILDTFDLFPQAQAIIQSLIDGFSNAIDGVRQWLQDLTQKIIEWKGPPDNDATLLNDAGASIIQSLIDGFMSAVAGVGAFLIGLTTSIVDYVMGIVTKVVILFQTGWAVLTTAVSIAFTNVFIAIQTILQIVWTFITTSINNGVIMFQTAWSVLVTIVTNVFSAILTIITTYFTAVWNFIQIVVQGILNVITIIFNGILNVISAVLTGIINVVTSIWNGIVSVFIQVLAAIKALISGNFNQFLSIIGNIFNTIWNTTKSVWNSIFQTIGSVLRSIFSTISSIFSSIWNTIKSVMNNILSTIKSIWDTIKSTISNTISSMFSTISGGLNNIKSNMSNAWESIKSTLLNAWTAMITSVTTKIASLIAEVKAIPDKAKSALGNVSNVLKSAGSDIIQGLINGVTSKISALQSKFSGITNMIPDWKGPPDTDAKLLTNAGELIMEGLISGLESKYGAVKNSLQGFTGELSQTVGTQIGADVGLTTSVRNTALSDAERRLSYRSNSDSMVQSSGGSGEVHLHFHNTLVNEEEIIMVVNREFGRG